MWVWWLNRVIHWSVHRQQTDTECLKKNKSTGQIVTVDFLSQLRNVGLGETPRGDSQRREAGINRKHTTPVQQDLRKVILLHPTKQDDVCLLNWWSGIANATVCICYFSGFLSPLPFAVILQSVPLFLNAIQAYLRVTFKGIASATWS